MTLLLSTVLVIFLCVRCKLKNISAKKEQAEREDRRTKAGRRGYTVQDEKEDDDSSDDDLSIDHQKPTLN